MRGGSRWEQERQHKKEKRCDNGRAFTKDRHGLEKELHRSLHLTRRRRADHLAEQGTADVGVHRRGPEEVGVIESIERFEAKLQRLRFSDGERLEKRPIEIDLTGHNER